MFTLVSAVLLLCQEQDGDASGACSPPEADTPGSGETFEEKMSDIMEKVMHSRMMEELKALPSEVMEELKNLPGEIRESLLLHVEQRSLMVAGVVVAVGAALLLLGCLWIHWCHTEHGEYRYIPISQVEEFLRYQKTSPSPHTHAHAEGSHGHRRRKHSEGSHRKVGDSSDHHGSTVTHRRTHNRIANGGQ